MPITAAIHRVEHVDTPDERAWELSPVCETLTLTARDWEAFQADLDDVDRPRPELEAAIRRYQARRQADAG